MILMYEFEYVSKNLVLENFLRVICEESGVKYSLCKDDYIVKLFINEDEDMQHKFASQLSSKLPLSLFLKSSNAKVVTSIAGKETKIENTAISLPFTKNAIDLAKEEKSFFHNAPFPPNEVGFVNRDVVSIVLEDGCSVKAANNSDEYEKIYKTAANLIKNGHKIKMKTPNGFFTFFEIKKDNFNDIDDFEVIPTDASIVQKMVNITDKDLQALLTLEKPIIRAKINTIYEAKDIISKSRVKVRMANSVYLQFICEELYKLGVEFIGKSEDVSRYDSFLHYDIDVPKIPDIEVSILENGETLVIRDDGYASSALVKGLDKLEKASIRKFVSIMKERNLFDYPTSCFYFSKKYNDAILYHDDEKGVLELVEFPTFSSMRDIFNTIKKQDESGKKLIESYQKNFPALYSFLFRIKIPKKLAKNFYNTMRFASLIAGLCNNFDEAGKILIEKAEDFGGQKGVRIDMKLEDEDKIHSNFDPYKTIRSVISFKLAGCDDMVLGFGLIESFSYFISDMADAHKETLGTQKIALGGALFGYPIIAESVAKNLLPNHQIFFNRELPID